uniref:Retrovirus-related Gag polyprotein from transposon gypsy n=1 Tax=Bactrocera dorsalis TaxID=27457 RepID=A0A034WA92_BACDO
MAQQAAEIQALQAMVLDLQRKFAEAQIGNTPIIEAQDEICTYTDPKEVDLELFKSAITVFSGDYHEYRNWRKLAITLMNYVKIFCGQNIYTEALILLRGKITGRAAQILISNNTKLNLDEIIDRLDDSYADQRPLYVLEEDMMRIRQGEKPLHIYYDHLNQALNGVLSKIEMSHKNEFVIEALSKEVQLKAIRTFIAGLKSTATKNALYSRNCSNLMEGMNGNMTLIITNWNTYPEHTRRVSNNGRDHKYTPLFIQLSCNKHSQWYQWM